jgi:hypothetical protein
LCAACSQITRCLSKQTPVVIVANNYSSAQILTCSGACRTKTYKYFHPPPPAACQRSQGRLQHHRKSPLAPEISLQRMNGVRRLCFLLCTNSDFKAKLDPEAYPEPQATHPSSLNTGLRLQWCGSTLRHVNDNMSSPPTLLHLLTNLLK